MQSLVRAGRSLRPLSAISTRTFASSRRLLPLLAVSNRPTVYNYASVRTKIWTTPFGEAQKAEKTVDSYMIEFLKGHKKNKENQEAMIDAVNPTKHLTYSRMIKKIRSIEGFLHEKGFKKGEVAAVVLPNCVEYPCIFTGIIARGGIFSGMPTLATPFELETMVRSCEATVIFTADILLEKVLAVAKDVSSIKTIVAVRMTDTPLPEGVVDWKEASKWKGAAPPEVKKNLDDVAIMPFSSGTTGFPKGVMLTHRNYMSALFAVMRHYETVSVPLSFPELKGDELLKASQTPLILYLPMYHIFGMICMSMCMMNGTPGITMAKFDPEVFLHALQKNKTYFVHLVPPVAMFLAKHPITEKFDLSSLRFALNGAAPLPHQVGKALTKKYPKMRVVQGYGLSETSILGCLPNPKAKVPYSNVGCVLPGLELKITNLDDGRELDTNETGEVCLRGVPVMKGYYKNQEETDKVIDKEGWFHTGDIGFVNEKEELTLVDRIKELIKVKGLQVAPAELEDVLLTSPKIADAAVIGVPHKTLGEAPRAFVVSLDPKMTEEDVKQVVKDHLAEYKWLEGGVVFVPEIPKSPAGKILRRLLPRN